MPTDLLVVTIIREITAKEHMAPDHPTIFLPYRENAMESTFTRKAPKARLSSLGANLPQV